eukprot:TRINITY_DN7064_c0_g1_i1.p1 TRINITY_DN7064_c0_g1~~TRINITY_DN7064_c0_g1_i1.p1  ORF type:complete len:447 (-),score=100.63 TRINITY_DN7064_c0_g1_i1:1230-2570(-)
MIRAASDQDLQSDTGKRPKLSPAAVALSTVVTTPQPATTAAHPAASANVTPVAQPATTTTSLVAGSANPTPAAARVTIVDAATELTANESASIRLALRDARMSMSRFATLAGSTAKTVKKWLDRGTVLARTSVTLWQAAVEHLHVTPSSSCITSDDPAAAAAAILRRRRPAQTRVNRNLALARSLFGFGGGVSRPSGGGCACGMCHLRSGLYDDDSDDDSDGYGYRRSYYPGGFPFFGGGLYSSSDDSDDGDDDDGFPFPTYPQIAPGSPLKEGEGEILDVKRTARCPLSMALFTNPVRNPQCSHVYERAAVESYVQQHPRTRYGAPAPCPVVGCRRTITLSALEADPESKKLADEHRLQEAQDDDSGSDGDSALLRPRAAPAASTTTTSVMPRPLPIPAPVVNLPKAVPATAAARPAVPAATTTSAAARGPAWSGHAIVIDSDSD